MHGHACTVQQRADAPGEGAVVGREGHGCPALRQVLQHTGGGALGFILGIGRGMQGHCSGRPAAHGLRQVHCATTFTPVLRQRKRQRVGLKALHHHQQRHDRAHTRLEQHVAPMARGKHPFQSDARRCGLQTQRTTVTRSRQQIPRRLTPGCALRRRNGRCRHRQLSSHLQERSRKCLTVLGQACALQQGACGDGIPRHVAGIFAAFAGRRAQLGSPVARGLEARRKALRIGALPLAARLAHQLCIGHQYHGGGHMRAARSGCGAHLLEHGTPASSAHR